jgi:uncharacterized membrane protein YdjX (TVP38/TMEM64 family)
MTGTTPPPHDDQAAPLGRIEAMIKADVEEARAIEPLVADAQAVQGRVRSLFGRALPLLALVALGAALVLGGVYEQLNLGSVARYHAQLVQLVDLHPVLAALALAGSIAAIISTGLPGGVVLVFVGGLLFGTWEGALISTVGDVTGGTLLYFAARRLFLHGGSPPALVEKIRAGFQRNPVSFAFFIRIVPAFPFGVASVALAWLGCRLRLFLVSSALGVLPSSLIYSAVGAGIGGALAEHEKISLSILAEPRFAIPLFLLGLLALLPALLGFRKRKPA